MKPLSPIDGHRPFLDHSLGIAGGEAATLSDGDKDTGVHATHRAAVPEYPFEYGNSAVLTGTILANAGRIEALYRERYWLKPAQANF